ncbi:hypothetical protein AB0K51_21410 [Kitasatospora sp. NPDC049285]|uniref:hypothetical protein n=1 Tax=Kitasatospora sp. NPDC049285 TaxID=3157096 RepID=UPI00342DE85D
MSNAPHLLAQDHPDFSRILDEALRDASVRQALSAPGRHLNAEQLHTKALAEADTVAAPADPEYRHYTALRAALAERAAPADGPLSRPLRSDQGAGLFPVLTVLTPILAGAAAVILLLLGYLLRAAAPGLALGRSVVTAGWAALAIGAAALLIGGAGLVLTALRDGSATPGGTDPHLHADLAEARAAWHTALRERAVLPWLHANLTGEPAIARLPAARPEPPELLSPGYSPAAYSSPGFTSPGAEGLTDAEGRGPRGGPGYTSPDFTSPGPEGLTDAQGNPRRAEFTGPGYTPPDFTGPDET